MSRFQCASPAGAKVDNSDLCLVEVQRKEHGRAFLSRLQLQDIPYIRLGYFPIHYSKEILYDMYKSVGWSVIFTSQPTKFFDTRAEMSWPRSLALEVPGKDWFDD